MFKIINLEEINKKYSRELGNEIVKEVSKQVLENIAKDYVFVRYMGPKFVIAFSGVETSGVAEFLNDIKEKIENTEVYLEDEEDKAVAPKLNFVLSSYYKGTGLEEVLKKLEEYLDNASINESDITNI